MEHKKTHTKEFKLNAIRKYLSGEHGGYTPCAAMLNITRTTLLNWVKKHAEFGEVGLEDRRANKVEHGSFVIPPKIEGLPITEENLRLKAENAYLRSILELNINIIKKNTLRSN